MSNWFICSRSEQFSLRTYILKQLSFESRFKDPMQPHRPLTSPTSLLPSPRLRKQTCFHKSQGWSGGAMVLGKLPVPGRPTIWITVGQGPTALTVGAGWGCLDIFNLIYPFSLFSPSLWETARYRPKYCLKGPLNPKQPTTTSLCTQLPQIETRN